MLGVALIKTSRFSNAWSNDIEFSGERKRVRCNEGLCSAAQRQVGPKAPGNVRLKKELGARTRWKCEGDDEEAVTRGFLMNASPRDKKGLNRTKGYEDQGQHEALRRRAEPYGCRGHDA